MAFSVWSKELTLVSPVGDAGGEDVEAGPVDILNDVC